MNKKTHKVIIDLRKLLSITSIPHVHNKWLSCEKLKTYRIKNLFYFNNLQKTVTTLWKT